MVTITHDFSTHKIINYFGNELIVPHWTAYVAIDNDGCIHAYSRRPMFSTNAWLIDNPDTAYELIAKCTFDIDASTTLKGF